jgi:hypothetical protein
LGHGYIHCSYGWYNSVLANINRYNNNNNDNDAGIAAGYGAGRPRDRGRVHVGAIFFSSLRGPDRLWGSPNLRKGALSPVIKRLQSEADHSPPTSAEAKNTWIYISNPPYASME